VGRKFGEFSKKMKMKKKNLFDYLSYVNKTRFMANLLVGCCQMRNFVSELLGIITVSWYSILYCIAQICGREKLW